MADTTPVPKSRYAFPFLGNSGPLSETKLEEDAIRAEADATICFHEELKKLGVSWTEILAPDDPRQLSRDEAHARYAKAVSDSLEMLTRIDSKPWEQLLKEIDAAIVVAQSSGNRRNSNYDAVEIEAFDGKIADLCCATERALPPPFPTETSLQTAMFRRRTWLANELECREVVKEQSQNNVQNENSGSSSSARRRGRNKADYETVQKEKALADKWKRAHEARVHKSDFARDQKLTVAELNKLLDRVAKRKRDSK